MTRQTSPFARGVWIAVGVISLLAYAAGMALCIGSVLGISDLSSQAHDEKAKDKIRSPIELFLTLFAEAMQECIRMVICVEIYLAGTAFFAIGLLIAALSRPVPRLLRWAGIIANGATLLVASAIFAVAYFRWS